MNPELQEFLLTCLKEGKDFFIEQAPLVLQEYIGEAILFGIFKVLGAFCGFGLLFPIYRFARHLYRQDYDDPLIFPISMLFGALLVFSLIFFGHGLVQVLSAWLFPRAYLLRTLLM